MTIRRPPAPPARFVRRFALAQLAAVLALSAPPDALAAERPPPSIVVVLIDDLGWGDFSCFGNEAADTPNIDRLAAEGIRFTQFYVNSPICSPSRTALTTGHYPQRWRITSFLNNRADNQRRGIANWLDPAAPTLARFLQSAGYRTGHFGKWHMGGQRDVGEAPLVTEYGFDASLTNFEGLGPRVLPLCDAHDGKPPRRHAIGSEQLGRGPIFWEDRSLVTASFVQAALTFIAEAEADGKPFFINLWPDDVHSPFFPPAARRGDGTRRTLYHGVLESMDEQLGVLLTRIRESDALSQNTLVLVCSDNGPEPGAGSAGPLRGTKTELYEGGIRSPLIVWGPGLVAQEHAGSTADTPVIAAIDLVPSLLVAAGLPVSREGNGFDGEDLLPTLLGRSAQGRKSPLFFRRPPDRPGQPGENLPDLAVRDGEWKLLCEYDGSATQLYRITSDHAESTNLADQHPEVATRLRNAVLDWHHSMPQDRGPEITPENNTTGKIGPPVTKP